MRAAMSHKFSRDYELGTQEWQANPLIPGQFYGNPSISTVVSQYMISLRRNKRIGPARSVRMMLQLLYIVSMLCLLRYDEALRITWQDVHFEPLENGGFRIRLDLPFRKTHQNGVQAFAIMWKLARANESTPSGFIFRKKTGRNGWSILPNDGMSTDSFMEYFRNNLLDIGIDPRPYGTHSFRRGGCQYLAMVLRWPFRNICFMGWLGGEFRQPWYLFKYLLSWTGYTPS
ncbi:hypothetical protein B0H14DRAFT_3101642 [Mycena olivaceomarginata]|nr:hypothetical protein B0H14DRAFT_3101642 [Mycena olivaceomarginata]